MKPLLAKFFPGMTLLLLATTVCAQDVPVRTGDHPGFTRIVIDFQQQPDWQLGRSGAAHELRVNAPELRFDLSDSFRRINQTRLRGLRDLGGGRLQIDTACACRLSVERLPNQGLVIDIRDERPDQNDRFEISLSDLPEVPSSGPDRVPAPLPGVLPVIFPDAPRPPRLGPLAANSPTGLPDAEVLARGHGARTALMEQAARAASQGLITFDSAQQDRIRAADERSTLPHRPELEMPHATDARIDAADHIRIESRIDRDMSGPVRGRQSEQPCLPADMVDIGTWFAPETLGDGLGAERMALIDPHDRPDGTAYAEFAKRLIYFSFGAEAKALIDGFEGEIADRGILREFAMLIDGEKTIPTGRLATQLSCQGAGPLWAVLAVGSTARLADLNAQSVVRSLSGFPPHLRAHLGPRLADQFLAQGDQASALSIRNAILRGRSTDDPTGNLITAQIDLAAGDRRKAEPNLAKVAASRSVEAADALAKLIEARIDDTLSVDRQLLDDAVALVFEIEGTEDAQNLTVMILRAMIHERRFDDALLLARASMSNDASDHETFAAYRVQTLDTLAREGDDEEFLRIALREIEMTPLSDPARLSVAARLAQLGLSRQARETLGNRADIPDADERRVLAEIALLDGKPLIAESYLAGLSDKVSENLRGRARDMNALPEVATKLESKAETTTAIGAGTLARNRELLSESRAVRENLRAILGNGG